MRVRQFPPRLWLMTDERQGDGLWDALGRLPKGAGVVLRHYGVTGKARRALIREVGRITRAGRIVLVAAGVGKGWRVAGHHGSDPRRHAGLRTAPVHNLRELVAAERIGVDLIFVSPIFPTRSHPGARPLGRRGFAAIANRTRIPAVALGGMTARRARSLGKLAYGWAAIDAWA